MRIAEDDLRKKEKMFVRLCKHAFLFFFFFILIYFISPLTLHPFCPILLVELCLARATCKHLTLLIHHISHSRANTGHPSHHVFISLEMLFRSLLSIRIFFFFILFLPLTLQSLFIYTRALRHCDLHVLQLIF